MDPFGQSSASASGQRTFDTLDAALTAWGKYDEYPYKVKAAHEAFRQLVALKGEPQNPDSNGRKPFYIIETGQYVAARWGYSIGLSFQAGFITGRTQLTPEWVSSSEDVKNSVGWWQYQFPDHLKFGRENETAGARKAQCDCSHGVGILQPIGSDCSFCEETIVASD